MPVAAGRPAPAQTGCPTSRGQTAVETPAGVSGSTSAADTASAAIENQSVTAPSQNPLAQAPRETDGPARSAPKPRPAARPFHRPSEATHLPTRSFSES